MRSGVGIGRTMLGWGALAALCALGGTRLALAVPLDIETCDKLVQQEAELERAGARANLAKGPQWAKANLPQDKIEQVRKLIEIDEQVAFRCLRTKPLPAEALVPQPLPPPVAAVPAPKPKPKPKPKPVVAKAPAEAGAGGTATPAAQPAPPPKPKPVVKAPAAKPADAYAPPPARSQPLINNN